MHNAYTELTLTKGNAANARVKSASTSDFNEFSGQTMNIGEINQGGSVIKGGISSNRQNPTATTPFSVSANKVATFGSKNGNVIQVIPPKREYVAEGSVNPIHITGNAIDINVSNDNSRRITRERTNPPSLEMLDTKPLKNRKRSADNDSHLKEINGVLYFRSPNINWDGGNNSHSPDFDQPEPIPQRGDAPEKDYRGTTTLSPETRAALKALGKSHLTTCDCSDENVLHAMTPLEHIQFNRWCIANFAHEDCINGVLDRDN